MTQPTTVQPGGIDLVTYAGFIRVDPDWLAREFRLCNQTPTRGSLKGRRVLEIPYLDDSGDEIAVLHRLAADGPDHSRWPRGTSPGQLVYGLHRLAAHRGTLCVATGEAACHVGSHLGLAMLTVPEGYPTAVRALANAIVRLHRFDDIVVWPEPRDEGSTRRLADELRRSRWAGRLRVVRHSDGSSSRDLLELHRQGLPSEETVRLVESLVRTAVKVGDSVNREEYLETPTGIVWMRPVRGGTQPTLLSNFVATITHEVTFESGEEPRTEFRIHARLEGKAFDFQITVEEFGRGPCWLHHLGAGAIVFPDRGLENRLQVAIQSLSRDVVRETVVERTGWTLSDDRWVFVHGGGLIGGSAEPVPGESVHRTGPESGDSPSPADADRGRKCRKTHLRVQFPLELARFWLPAPLGGRALRKGIREVLRFLRITDTRVTVPILAAVFRAPLGRIDTSLLLFGGTGTHKSSVAAVAQQFFGPGLDRCNLPASWLSTANALERQVHDAQDVLLVIDNLIPRADPQARGKFERITQAVGDQAARGRLSGNGGLRKACPPKALILSTGEDIPGGESCRGRSVLLEMPQRYSPAADGPETLMHTDLNCLAWCQEAGASGVYAGVMAAYLSWLAPRIEGVRADLAEKALARSRLFDGIADAHPRTPVALAQLLSSMDCLLTFAASMGAITRSRAERIGAWAAGRLRITGQSQVALGSEKPADRFIDLLRSSITSYQAHLAASDCGLPYTPAMLGWTRTQDDIGEEGAWRPQGERVGWIASPGVFLEPYAALRAAQRAAPRGQPFDVTVTMLSKHLFEAGLLLSHELNNGQRSYLCRKVFDRRLVKVWHLPEGTLFPLNVGRLSALIGDDAADGYWQ